MLYEHELGRAGRSRVPVAGHPFEAKAEAMEVLDEVELRARDRDVDPLDGRIARP
jgi:hypothetical protein